MNFLQVSPVHPERSSSPQLSTSDLQRRGQEAVQQAVSSLPLNTLLKCLHVHRELPFVRAARQFFKIQEVNYRRVTVSREEKIISQ